MLRWIFNFVQGRMGRVRCNNAQSTLKEYRYGLPQGSFLSPILFNVFFRDVFRVDVNSADLNAAVYADDISITATGRTVEAAAAKLTKALESVDKWGKQNKVRFDKQSDKCGYLIFSRSKKVDQQVRFGQQELHRLTSHKHLGVIFNESLTFTEHITRVKAKAWSAYHAIRRAVGSQWGATTKTVMRLYEGLVRPVLEAACVVWDSATEATKKPLERIHRLCLLAATQANKRTSTKELEVYCNTQSLQDRRDFVAATYYNRIQRLDPEQHPVARVLRDWKAARSPHFGARAPFLPRAASLCRRLCRFTEFDAVNAEYLERIPNPPPRKNTTYFWRPPNKELAKSEHIKLINRLSPRTDIVIYTDGSAIPNPGRIGLGVSAICNGEVTTYGESVGIGSNITAELCAINSALRKTLQTNLHDFHRVFIFSDCQAAIDLALKRCTASDSFQIVDEIHAMLQKLQPKISVIIKWVPAHIGVPGNEAADRAAKNAAKKLMSMSPRPGQPPLTLATSRAFIRRTLKQRKQQQWFSVVAEKSGLDHLSRLRADVSFSPAFFVGTRVQQTILARLRFGTCNLNFSRSRLEPVNEECECGHLETVNHFLLHCHLYHELRQTMISEVQSVWKGVINEEVLLGGGGVRLLPEQWSIIVASVAKFVSDTKRSI